MDRAHRIGQTKPVLVLRLCTSDSVEVKLLRRAHSKLALERLVIKKGAFQGDATAAGGKDSLSAQDLLDVLKGNVRLEVRRPAPAMAMYSCSFTRGVLFRSCNCV
jgi:ATP-dependent DNA helicase